ncbi:MAG: phosphoribosylformylglycinamidine cyclo-ligase [Planctomycetota bacterium]|jgi:phosphoribosylformylglycinamidine cyclo-ligase
MRLEKPGRTPVFYPVPQSCSGRRISASWAWTVHHTPGRPLPARAPCAPLTLSEEKALTYKDTGVDIAAQDEALARSKDAIRESFTPGVLGDVGLFGGLFDPAKVGCADTILVSSADGVGTKLEVARRAGIHDGVGRDLVQHCINDVLVQGAKPLFFMDYVAMGKLEPEIVADLIRGCAEACRDNGLALLGGETAEMPGVYRDGDFELCGFMVGAVQRDHLLDGSKVRAGQVLLGLGSDGLHTNGYSLARHILFERMELGLDDRPELLGGKTVVEALLAQHRPYYTCLWPLIESKRLAAMAHITGGGLPGNVNRILGNHDAEIDGNSWELPGLFQLLIEGGGLERSEAFHALNMGIGMVLVVEAEEVDAITKELTEVGERVTRIGDVVAGTGQVHVR